MRFLLLLTVFSSLFTACYPEPVPPVETPTAPDEPEDRPGAEVEIAPKLGVNFTWAADDMIDGDPTLANEAFTHVRFFQMMSKDYLDGPPSQVELEPCTDLDNPWSCPARSPRQHLLRVLELKKMFPDGKIWIAPEVIIGKGWPCKGWNVAELGDPYEAGYNWAAANLATFGPVGNVILATDNEEWCPETGRAEAYNQWRRGIIQAHRENPSCELALGARHVRERTFGGQVLPDRVFDVSPDVWAYIDEIGGWADYHAHGIENGNFLSRDEAETATDFQDFFAWSAWLDDNYPNINKAVGEIAYTSSKADRIPSDSHKRADWPTYKNLLSQLAVEADQVYMYQIAEHQSPEGAFSGSGVYPALMDSVRAFADETVLVP